MVVQTLIIPKLGLSRKTDAALLTYSGEICGQLTLNAADFPALKPTVAEVEAAQVIFSGTLDKMAFKNKANTDAKNDARLELENLHTLQAYNCAEIANGDVTLYRKSGYDLKSKGVPSGFLPAPGNFKISLGSMEGSLYAKFKGVKNAYSYEIFYGNADVDPDTWTKYKVTTAGKILLNELGSNILTGVRVRAIGAKGKTGEWTAILTLKTY